MVISLWVMGILFVVYFAFSFPFVLNGYYQWKLEKLEEENE